MTLYWLGVQLASIALLTGVMISFILLTREISQVCREIISISHTLLDIHRNIGAMINILGDIANKKE